MNIGTPEKIFFPVDVDHTLHWHCYQQVTNDRVFWEVGEFLAPSNQYPPEYLCLSSKYFQRSQRYYLDVFEGKP